MNTTTKRPLPVPEKKVITDAQIEATSLLILKAAKTMESGKISSADLLTFIVHELHALGAVRRQGDPAKVFRTERSTEQPTE